MIVRFTLTPASLYLESVEENRRPGVLRFLTRVWGRVGRLVIFNGDEGRQALLNEVKFLPQNLRKLWQKNFSQFRFIVLPDRLPEINGITEIDIPTLARNIQVLGHGPQEKVEADLKELEAVIADRLIETSAFIQAMDMADMNLTRGESTAQIWRERFQPIVQSSNKIILVDRYCLRSISKNSHKIFNNSGLFFFLNKLKNSSPKKITIYSSINDFNQTEIGMKLEWAQIQKTMKLVNCEFNKEANHSVQVKVLPDSIFKNVHDRFLVFDYQTLEIGTGLEMLEGEKLRRGTTCTLKQKSQSHLDMLSELERGRKQGFLWSSHH
jgi:hypothetical protein